MSWGWFDDSMHAQTLVLKRVTVGAPDADGVAATTSVEHELEGYGVTPAGSQESSGEEKVITTRYHVSGPVTALVREHDEIAWNGTVFQVEGEPQTYVGGVLDHTEFFINKPKG
ncbi:hypothetical protein BRM3_08925 [Brachybacterium huguangmaarense]|uniref:Head-to-tail stopper n=1 Tax=Brachybacterium huguangmaarense TaxID=1652028 RepID=A0ABY6FY32_9MICO|nr:hypothetical protein [Brachybacterium huguangmaarense]UYG15767.1 hypothetical protein BRM3_08925 [Brachybacterium huguangmaarense]